MYDVAVLLEHVHLLNCLDRLNIEFLQRGLQLSIVGAWGLVNFLLFPPRCSFAPVSSRKSAFCFAQWDFPHASSESWVAAGVGSRRSVRGGKLLTLPLHLEISSCSGVLLMDKPELCMAVEERTYRFAPTAASLLALLDPWLRWIPASTRYGTIGDRESRVYRGPMSY